MTDKHYRQAKSGRWFSRAWWTGHWDVRAECGRYASIDQAAAGTCPESHHKKHAARLHRQLEQEHRNAQRSLKNAKRRHGASPTREQRREEMRIAQHAQDLRAEAVALGHKRETRAFYGSMHESQSDVTEKRLTIKDSDREHAAQRAHDREAAEAHRLERKTKTKAQRKAEEEALHRDLEAAGW